MRRLKQIAAGLLAAGIVFAATAAAAQVQRTTIYSFSDREGFLSTLAIDANGTLYGDVGNGGPNVCQAPGVSFGCGAVFRLTPPALGQTAWTQDFLHAFAQDATGFAPSGGLGIEANGSLLGFDSNTFVQLFELTPPPGGAAPWSATALFRTGSQSGENLIPDGQGGFFILTQSGNTFSDGWALSRLVRSGGVWTAQTLYNFTEGRPTGIAADSQGAVYGNYFIGGKVFQLKQPAGQSAWVQTVIHEFPNATLASSLFVDSKGAVYGVTRNGGNDKIFKLTLPKAKQTKWAVATPVTFNKKKAATQGLYPLPVIVDSVGNIFGTTAAGGPNTSCPSGCGTLFRLSPIAGTTKYAMTVLDNYGSTTIPTSGSNTRLTADKNGVLYGMTGTDQYTVSGGTSHFTRPATVFQVTGSGYQP